MCESRDKSSPHMRDAYPGATWCMEFQPFDFVVRIRRRERACGDDSVCSYETETLIRHVNTL